jgi:cysteine-rich repeat protein
VAGEGGAAGSGAAGAGGGSGAGGAGGAGVCGDGAVGSGEECDDGNAKSGDGCSSSCSFETNCQSDNAHPAITCGQTLSGSFSGKYGDVDNPCGKSFKYQDIVFVYKADKSGPVTVNFTGKPDQADMAMFVMRGACHDKLCFADSTSDGERHDVSFDAEAGVTYYIDLEAPSFQPNFSITLQCP